MKFRIASGVAVAGLLAGLTAAPAFAGSLSYYDSNSYGSKIGSFTCSTGKVMHDVVDDRINSVKNATSCDFSARSWDWIPNTTIEVGYVSAGQNIPSFGSRNNQIDHFDRD